MRSQFLLVVLFVATVTAHPAVSNPKVVEQSSDEMENIYAQGPNETPLHTTILMAGRRMNGELRR